MTSETPVCRSSIVGDVVGRFICVELRRANDVGQNSWAASPGAVPNLQGEGRPNRAPAGDEFSPGRTSLLLFLPPW